MKVFARTQSTAIVHEKRLSASMPCAPLVYRLQSPDDGIPPSDGYFPLERDRTLAAAFLRFSPPTIPPLSVIYPKIMMALGYEGPLYSNCADRPRACWWNASH